VIAVAGVPSWVDARRLLGPGTWDEVEGRWVAHLGASDEADVQARLRAVVLGGRSIGVEIDPPPPRALVRAARLRDARARRHTTAGFLRKGARLDGEGRISLTPEVLAVAIGRQAAGRHVVDATCGCGGNAIGFARAGCTVVAVDMSSERLALARHNAGLYGVLDRITFAHADAREVVPDFAADLVFVDPPWSDPDLPPLGELADAVRAEMWAKVPPAYDPRRLPGSTPEAWFGEAEGDRHRVKLLVLKRGPVREDRLRGR
jgi:SAM-dependent methyltransferase